MRYAEQNAAEKCKKGWMFDVRVNHSAYNCPVKNLDAKRHDKQFFEQVPLEFLFVKPQKLSLNLSILHLNKSYIDFLMKASEKERGVDKDGDSNVPGHGGIL